MTKVISLTDDKTESTREKVTHLDQSYGYSLLMQKNILHPKQTNKTKS